MPCEQQMAIGQQTEKSGARLLYVVYGLFGGGVWLLASLLLPVLRLVFPLFSSRCRYGLAERLGYYSDSVRGRTQTNNQLPCVWIHGASVGEVQAALQLIAALEGQARIVLSTNTEQGHRLARARLEARALCLMAPLDLPQAVRRALAHIRPDVYVCLETELWPLLLTQMSRAGIPLLLLNGRLSERSFGRYRRIRFFMRSLLGRFQAVAAISKGDAERFLALGLPETRLRICGNMKYDLDVPDAARAQQMRDMLRKRLDIADDSLVFVCGSTHGEEERQLLSVYARLNLSLCVQRPIVWILAPRHLERREEVENLLQTAGLGYERYSLLKKEGKKRAQPVVLVDTMGDLAELYACGDYLFCGGSLVPLVGGHNLMEAARWGRPVYFGPYMKEFRDVATILQEAGGGFQARNAEHLAELILSHQGDWAAYHRACEAAVALAREQQGATRRQAALIRPLLTLCKQQAS